MIVLGETEQEKYGNNLNELLARFGIEIENATVQDYEHHRGDAPSWVLADLVESATATGPDPLAGVSEACFYRAGTLALSNGAEVIARTYASAAPPTAPLAAVTHHGAGRVVVLADSDLFGDDCIGALDHEAFWVNLAYYAAEPAFGAGGEPIESAAAADPAWGRLRDAVEELRVHEAPTAPSTSPVPTLPTRLGCASWSMRSRRAPRRSSGTSRTSPSTSRRSAGISTSGSMAATARPTSCARSRRSGPSRTGATASSISPSSRCTSRTARPTPASRR